MTEKTGWPPGMLQDDDRALSRWFASRPNAMQEARMVADELSRRSRQRRDKRQPWEEPEQESEDE